MMKAAGKPRRRDLEMAALALQDAYPELTAESLARALESWTEDGGAQERLLGIREFMERSGYRDANSVYRAVTRGLIRSVKVGGKRMFPESSLVNGGGGR
jgi:hypothetical protein